MKLTFLLPPSLGHAKASARAELIEVAMARELNEPVSAVVASSYADLEEQAARAEFVWAPTVVCAKFLSARAVYTIVRKGQATYRSALIARRDRAITPSGLSGLRAAWVDPLSAGGYLLAVAWLRSGGLDPDRLFASQRFVGSHRAAIEAVLHGEADVAGVSTQGTDEAELAATMRWYAGPAGDQVGAIAITDSCPNDAIVLTTNLGEVDAEWIGQRLAPFTRAPRVRSRLLSVLEADRLEPTELSAYRRAFPFALLERVARRSSFPGPPR
jgi:ABC-type phosphate/phosphonate transport system substrate-binding protein